jgi:hypothetical protein
VPPETNKKTIQYRSIIFSSNAAGAVGPPCKRNYLLNILHILKSKKNVLLT